jgi:hypothetical protein
MGLRVVLDAEEKRKISSLPQFEPRSSSLQSFTTVNIHIQLKTPEKHPLDNVDTALVFYTEPIKHI